MQQGIKKQSAKALVLGSFPFLSFIISNEQKQIEASSWWWNNYSEESFQNQHPDREREFFSSWMLQLMLRSIKKNWVGQYRKIVRANNRMDNRYYYHHHNYFNHLYVLYSFLLVSTLCHYFSLSAGYLYQQQY